MKTKDVEGQEKIEIEEALGKGGGGETMMVCWY